MATLQQECDSKSGDLETRPNPIKLVNTFHMKISMNELMFVAVQINGIRVKVVVDTGAMHSFLASNVAGKSSLTIEAYDSVVPSLNGRWHHHIRPFEDGRLHRVL